MKGKGEGLGIEIIIILHPVRTQPLRLVYAGFPVRVVGIVTRQVQFARAQALSRQRAPAVLFLGTASGRQCS